VAELVDAHDSKSCGATRESSSLSSGTIKKAKALALAFLMYHLQAYAISGLSRKVYTPLMIEKEGFFSHEAPTLEIPNFELKIRELTRETGVPENVLLGKDIEVASGLLALVHASYDDPNSPDYRPYHNSSHSLDVLRRAWTLWGKFTERVPGSCEKSGYKTLLFDSCGHELYVDETTEEGKDEKRSAKFTMRYMISHGYTCEEAREVYEDINATAVKRNENGLIVQYNVRKGSKRPTKFALARSDTDGILMEGIPTMIENAINLQMEFKKLKLKDILLKPQNAAGMLLMQADFIEQRLESMDEDIAYHFEGEDREIVKEIIEEEFNPHSREAISLAHRIKNAPELGELAVRNALKAANKSTGNISSLGGKVSGLIRGLK
jgi:hypothetical protein